MNDSCSAEVVLVDLCHDWVEYLAHNLLTARAIAFETGARVVGITGRTSVILRACPQIDFGIVTEMASAFGVEEVIRLPELAEPPDGELSAEAAADVRTWIEVCAVRIAQDAINEMSVRGSRLRCAYESVLRASLQPSTSPSSWGSLRSVAEVAIVDDWIGSLFARWNVVAVVTGHVDYNPWRLLAERSSRAHVPCFYVQLDGGAGRCRLYRLHDADAQPGPSVRTANARGLQHFMAGLRDSPELEVERFFAAEATGRTSYRSHALRMPERPDVRLAVRADVRRRFGIAAGSRLVAVCAHTACDMPLSDVQAFLDHETWLRGVLNHARGQSTVEWWIRTHPLDRLYDSTGLLKRLQREYCDAENIRFLDPGELTISEVLIACDAAVTLRGSVGIQAASIGLPCVMGGASAYSDCGFSEASLTRDEFLRHLDRIASGDTGIDRSHVDMARAYIYYDAVGGALRSTLLDDVGSGHSDNNTFFERLARRLPRWAPETDPFVSCVRALWRSNGSIRGLMPTERQAPRTAGGCRHAVHEGAPPRRKWTFETGSPDLHLLTSGFGDAELEGSWVTAACARLWLPLGTGLVPFRHVRLRTRTLVRAPVIVRIGDVDAIEILQAPDDFVEVMAPWPLDRGSDGVVGLSIHAERLHSPAELGLNGDVRQLLLCLHSVEVLP